MRHSRLRNALAVLRQMRTSIRRKVRASCRCSTLCIRTRGSCRCNPNLVSSALYCSESSGKCGSTKPKTSSQYDFAPTQCTPPADLSPRPTVVPRKCPARGWLLGDWQESCAVACANQNYACSEQELYSYDADVKTSSKFETLLYGLPGTPATYGCYPTNTQQLVDTDVPAVETGAFKGVIFGCYFSGRGRPASSFDCQATPVTCATSCPKKRLCWCAESTLVGFVCDDMQGADKLHTRSMPSCTSYARRLAIASKLEDQFFCGPDLTLQYGNSTASTDTDKQLVRDLLRSWWKAQDARNSASGIPSCCGAALCSGMLTACPERQGIPCYVLGCRHRQRNRRGTLRLPGGQDPTLELTSELAVACAMRGLDFHEQPKADPGRDLERVEFRCCRIRLLIQGHAGGGGAIADGQGDSARHGPSRFQFRTPLSDFIIRFYNSLHDEK